MAFMLWWFISFCILVGAVKKQEANNTLHRTDKENYELYKDKLENPKKHIKNEQLSGVIALIGSFFIAVIIINR